MEQLEQLLLMSATGDDCLIEVLAAGWTGEEQMSLQIDGVTVQTWDNIGGDYQTRDFESFTYQIEGPITADRLRVVFENDLFDSANGIDRNLTVDSISIDGEVFETEDPSTFSTGTWLTEDGVVAGNRESEVLHTNGYIEFADESSPPPPPGDGSTINVIAFASEGTETMELRIDGVVVQTWNNVSTATQTYAFQADTLVSADQIRVALVDAQWDPANGMDENLLVDRIEIDGEVFETEDPSTFSTATWKPEDGITPGFRESEALNHTGYFQYADETTPPPPPGDGSTITVFAAGESGTEDFELQIDGVAVAAWTNIDAAPQGYAFTTDTTVTADQIRVAFVNAQYDPANGIDENLVVDRIEIDGIVFETEADTVFSTGTWLPADGIQPGFRQSEFLHNTGYFQYDADQPEPPPADTTPPTASLAAANINSAGGTDYTFTVTYSDASGIDAATLDGSDIEVVRDDGLTQQAEFVSVSNGTATYRVTAPGGGWNASGNGTYTVRLLGGQVADNNGNFTPEIVLGTFSVQIAGNPTTAPPIINGSFEANSVTGGAWSPIAAASVPGWQSLNGEAIEHWDSGHNGVASTDGNNHIELDYRGAEGQLDGIYQDLQTEAGVSYDLTFDIRSRSSNSNSDDEAVVVEWNGVKTSVIGYRADSPGQWTTHTVTVVGTGGNDRLLFRESGSAGASDGTGPLLDNIRFEVSDGDNFEAPKPNGLGFTSEALATGLDNPLAFTYADDGRIFVTEKAGRVKIIENGQVVSTFIDINEEVNSYWDRGLMGVALDPDFEENGWVYLSYVVDLEPENPDRADFNSAASGRLIRVKANGNVADLSTREVILDGHRMTHATHAVGDVDFDNDGNLIFNWGDGGFGDNLRFEAQDPDSKQGKFFRIDPDTGFGVEDNPFFDPDNPDSVRSKVWAIGVRNPWRWSVDRATGDVYFGEVTDGGPEEANIIRANITDPLQQLNFGWPYFEDDIRTSYGTVPANFVYEDAYVALPHAGGYDAITGGAVYRGAVYPEIYDGRYFFANFGQNVIYTADANGNFSQFGNFGEFSSPVDIQLAPNGTIQYMSMFEGTLYQLNYDPSSGAGLIPNAEATASITAGTGPLTVDFSSAGSNSPNGSWLRYEWDFDSNGTIDSTTANPAHTYSTIGTSTATLTVTDDVGGSDTVEIEVTVVATAPNDGNLAFGQETLQTNTAAGGLASRAVDGNTDSTFANGSVATTAVEDKAFWEVDLGAIYDLSSIEIYVGNQTLSNYYVLASADEFSGGNLSAVLEDPGVWRYSNTGDESDLDTVSVNAVGRYVRIQLAEFGALSLAEVKVFGTTV